MRRSRRISGAKIKRAEKQQLKIIYTNHLGMNTVFNNRTEYVKHAQQTNGDLLRLHNQGMYPYCALYSIVTAMEVARKQPWTKEERKERYEFCLREGKKQGDHLSNTLKYYKKNFGDMEYENVLDDDYAYGNANHLVEGLTKGVCVVSISCADVYTKFKIRSKKCDKSGDWHCITCVAFVNINGVPTFVFKDTNNHQGDSSNLAFLPAKEVVDGVSKMQEYGDPLEAISKLKKEVWKDSLTLLQEIYFITPDKVYERIVTPIVYVEKKKKEKKKEPLRKSRRTRRPRRLSNFSNLKL